LFLPDEDGAGGGRVVVLSYGLWLRRFGGSRDVIGKTVVVNTQPYTVVGIAPEGFNGVNVGLRPELWLPLAIERRAGSARESRDAREYFAVGRLQPGITVAEARAALDLLGRRLEETYPETNRGVRFTVLPEGEGRLHPMVRTGAFGFSGVLVGVAGLLLLVACANVAGLLFVRAAGRRKEIALRLAMGATRGRILQQLLTESALLAIVAGVAGVALTSAVVRVLKAVHLPIDVPLFLDLTLDWRVVGASVLVTGCTAIGFALAPAIDASRADLSLMLKDGETTWTGLRRARLHGAVVAVQVAVSMVLLIVGGLFLRSLQTAQRVDVGFDPSGVVMTAVDLASQGYQLPLSKVFWPALLDRARALPPVKAVSLAMPVPLELNLWTTAVGPEGYQPPPDGAWPSIEFAVVGPDYFNTLRIPILDGREFDDRDNDRKPAVVIVNDVLAAQFWPRQRAVGKRLVAARGGRAFEVIGVAKRSKYLTLGEDAKPYLYLPLYQNPRRAMTLVARGNGDPMTALHAVRETVRSLDDTLPPYNIVTMSEHVALAVGPARFAAMVLNAICLVAVALTSVGLYGTQADVVSRRTYEIGIRRALGAQDGNVVWLVVRQAVVLVIVGLGSGLVLGLTSARLLNSLLYGAAAVDPLVFGLAPVVLIIICVLASGMPAYRATRIEAAKALRYE
jgi:predicted permease